MGDWRSVLEPNAVTRGAMATTQEHERVALPVLDVRDLTVEFRTVAGPVRAVRSVSFQLKKGEKLAIVGESGSGKSTLGLSLLRLLGPSARVVKGGVWLSGRDLLGLSEKELGGIRGRDIAMIFQDPLTALDPVKTVGSQIVETVMRHQAIGKKAARRLSVELLRDVEIRDAQQRADDYPHQFSGGMRQRVMIAIALANEPDVVVADEPTTALDVTTQAQVIDVLERVVADRGTAVVFVTHNMGLVADFCETCAVMYAGRFVEEGRVMDFFRAPTHPYSEALLEAIPRPGVARLEAIPGVPPNPLEVATGCAFEPRCRVGSGLDRCRSEHPETQTVGARGDHRVKCHFAVERWRSRTPQTELQ